MRFVQSICLAAMTHTFILIAASLSVMSSANGQSPLVPVHRHVQALPVVTAPDKSPLDIVKLSYERPVIAIRFLGSLCSHCMQQIVRFNERADTLRRYNARVIAFSDNSIENCAEVTRTYRIDTTVITIGSDANNAASRVLGTTISESDGSTTEVHAVLVVHRGRVLFEHYAKTPLLSFGEIAEALAATKR